MPAIFQPQIAKKINKALSAICGDYKLLWWDSYKGTGCASTLPESIQHMIIVTIKILDHKLPALMHFTVAFGQIFS